MKKLSIVAGVLALPFIATGCASITGTPNQSISVQTREQTGVAVVGAACELTNDVGKWFVTTPGSVGIHRSNKDLQVSCKKIGFEPGQAAVVSDTKGAMFGNIIFGGGIGAVIDHNSGAAYEYPSVIDILMGGFTKIEIPKTQATQQDTQTNTASKTLLVTSDATINTTSGSPTPSNVAIPQKLRDLQGLKNDGIITEDEFQKKKQLLLENM